MKKYNLTWEKLINNVIENKEYLDLKVDSIFSFLEKYKSNNGKKKLRLFSEDGLFWRDIENLYSEIPENNIGKKLLFTTQDSFSVFEKWLSVSEDIRQRSWMFSDVEVKQHQKSKPALDKNNNYFFLYDCLNSFSKKQSNLEYCSIMFLFSTNVTRLNKLFKKRDLDQLTSVLPPKTHFNENIIYEKKYKRNYDISGKYLPVETRFCNSILDLKDFSYLENKFHTKIENILSKDIIGVLDKQNNPKDLSIISKIKNPMDWKVYESTWNKLIKNKQLNVTKIKNEIATKIDFGNYVIDAFKLCSLNNKTKSASVFFLQNFPPSIWSSIFNTGTVIEFESKEFNFYLLEMNYFLQKETACYFGGSCSEYKVSTKVSGGIEHIYEAEDLIMLAQIFTHKSNHYDFKKIMFSLRQLQKPSFEQECTLRLLLENRE